MKYLLYNDVIRGHCITYIKSLDLEEGKLQQVIVSDATAIRNLAQNRHMHKLFRMLSDGWVITKGEWFSPTSWKTHLKEIYLGYDSIQLPSGEIREVLRSTADLSVKEGAEFIDHIYTFADEHGIPLPAKDVTIEEVQKQLVSGAV